MDWMTSSGQIAFWLVLAILFVVVELVSVSLLSIWFAVGAVCAMAVAWLKGPLYLQILIFLVVSGGMLVLIRKWAVKHVNGNKTKTNATDRAVGQITRITERVSNLDQTGRAVVLGQDWSVRAEDDKITFEVGDLVQVVRISGVKLIVKKAEEET